MDRVEVDVSKRNKVCAMTQLTFADFLLTVNLRYSIARKILIKIE